MPSLMTPEGLALDIAIDCLIIAGWAGGDESAVEHHIQELEALGVARPSNVPCFYRVGRETLSTSETIQVLGADSSGEAEVIVLSDADGVHWVGVASDHTDRVIEAYSVPVSKQACPKPLAPLVWRLDDVEGHWDELELLSYAVNGGERTLYQQGKIASLRSFGDLASKFTGGYPRLPPKTAMLCGTLAAIGGIRPSDAFSIELVDHRLGRAIRHSYAIERLPVVS
ncbi:MAG: DUF2848 domain-containing protein [Chelatococcus sp.]|uniref:DUF2848 domain-containing protein n=1 Tax=Chelatococcus sp. TaxID=1953771 RepID=UPI0025BE816E|nr:DUF2848 domain-containing protein [Chelatococcus sp.]MBX3540421.1 DUF2848 domain-containing protein [Chelatococcus sp.]